MKGGTGRKSQMFRRACDWIRREIFMRSNGVDARPRVGDVVRLPQSFAWESRRGGAGCLPACLLACLLTCLLAGLLAGLQEAGWLWS